VRVVAATKTDLGALARQGRFREDLFYRLNVVALGLPSLAERVEDIPALIEHFIARHGAARRYAVGPETMKMLVAAPWPGNVRELENAVCRAIALTPEGGELRAEDLIRAAPGTATGSGSRPPNQVAAAAGDPPPAPAAPIGPIAEVVAAAERAAIERALAATGGVRAEAAKLLGISRKTLWEKISKLGMSSESKE